MKCRELSPDHLSEGNLVSERFCHTLDILAQILSLLRFIPKRFDLFVVV